MATPANPGSGAPPQGGAPQPQGQGGGGGNNPLQIIAAMTRLAQMLAEAAPPCQPEAEKIMQASQACAQKIMGASQPQSGGGPSPY